MRGFGLIMIVGAAAGILAACSGGDRTAPVVVDHMVFLLPPSQTHTGQAITPAVQVALVDVMGNTVVSARDSVTVALAAPIPGGGVLSGTLIVRAVAGVASFSNLHISPVATGYKLVATSSSLPSVTSGPFDVFAPMPAVATAVITGRSWTCALTSAGPYCWGHNGGGELGINADSSRLTPAAVMTQGVAFSELTAGGAETCGIVTPGGGAYCWGHNYYGGVGDGTAITRYTPVAVLGSHTFTALSGGDDITCGLTPSGAAYCWGYNAQGQLGVGSTTNASAPDSVYFGPFASISAGASYTCGVTAAGAAYCWGSGFGGEIGDGTYLDTSTPVAVAGGHTFSVVKAGGGQTCGLDAATGAAYCWGNNSNGQVGDGTTIVRATPVAVSGGLFFSAIATGGNHTCGIQKSTNLAFCWGFNDVGQLGDGTTTDESVPTSVSGGHKFAQLSAGLEHVCGLETGTGTVWCWGGNSYSGGGALGNGTMIDSHVPVAVVP